MKEKKHGQIDKKQYEKDVRKYETLRFFAKGGLKRFFKYDYKYTEPEGGPFLIMANHAVNLDPVLLGLAFPHMYFVASEHILSWGAASKLIVSLLHPIARKKGSVDALTVLEIRRRLNLGASIGIFPEGNRTMSGVTESIHPTTVKLVRSCKCGLITYRIKGGFLLNPRFSKKLRRGKTSGDIVNVYTKEDLAGMTDDEIYKAICEDLYENAFETQRKNNYRYKCKAPAKGMPTALYLCPECGSYCSLEGGDDYIRCKNCSMTAYYDEYGRLTGAKSVSSYDEWFLMQKPSLEKAPETLVFRDGGVKISTVPEGEHERKATPYTEIIMDRKRLTLRGEECEIGEDISAIPSMMYYGVNNLVFYIGREYFVVTGDMTFNARKYIDLYETARAASDRERTDRDE